jgi:hypothetical protein
MRSHLLIIKVFFVVGAVWLYVIHPTRIPPIQKLGPAPIIEQAARFTFPEIKSTPGEDVARISGEHRELSLREVSSVGKASVGPLVKSRDASPPQVH